MSGITKGGNYIVQSTQGDAETRIISTPSAPQPSWLERTFKGGRGGGKTDMTRNPFIHNDDNNQNIESSLEPLTKDTPEAHALWHELRTGNGHIHKFESDIGFIKHVREYSAFQCACGAWRVLANFAAQLWKEWDGVSQRGPHILTAHDGEQAYCGGPGTCKACNEETK